MNKLFDETYGDENQSSRNIWYGFAKITQAGAYGEVMHFSDTFLNEINELIHADLETTKDNKPTETNWYIYGDTKTKDAIEEEIRPSLMIKEKANQFYVHVNYSDQNFAINFEMISNFTADLTTKLNRK